MAVRRFVGRWSELGGATASGFSVDSTVGFNSGREREMGLWWWRLGWR